MAKDALTLRRTLRDLVTLTTLPAVWSARPPDYIATSLAEVLVATLHMDLVYIQLQQAPGILPLERVQTPDGTLTGVDAHLIGQALQPRLKIETARQIATIPNPLTPGLLQVTVIPLGYDARSGFLLTGVKVPSTLEESDVLLINVAVNQALTAIQQAQILMDVQTANDQKDRAFAREKAHRKRIAGLQSITAAFSQALTIDQIARIAVDQTVNLLKASSGMIHLLADSGTVIEMRYRTGENRLNVSLPNEVSDPRVNQVIQTRLPLWLEKLKPDRSSALATMEPGSVALLPLIMHGQLSGVIEYRFARDRKFSQSERDFMLAVSYQCVQALERARLYESELAARRLLQIRVQLQSVIAALGQEALVSFDLPALLDQAATLLAQALDVEYTEVLELLPAENSLLLRSGVGREAGQAGEVKVSAGYESQAGYTLLLRQPVMVDDARTETRFKASPLLVEHQVISGMTVIIEGYQRPWGVLGVHSHRPRLFTPDDIYFVQSVANILGAALERDRLDTLLHRSNADLQQFASVASHDLQEPLRMVTSYMQLLESRYAASLDENAREFIGFAVDGAKRMQALIAALLAYARVGGDDLALEEFDAQAALDKALANLALQIEDSGARITQDVLPRIKASPVQIAQLFQNLISNALKFQRGAVPEMHIGVERKPGEWQFYVRDNGIGIAPEALERIFIIFQRLHTRDKYPGTGIGLAISKKVVERHGGQMRVESLPGQGTTFYFTIPV